MCSKLILCKVDLTLFVLVWFGFGGFFWLFFWFCFVFPYVLSGIQNALFFTVIYVLFFTILLRASNYQFY